jgi:allantoinase
VTSLQPRLGPGVLDELDRRLAPADAELAAATGTDQALVDAVLPGVLAKLEREPVEDLRIDSEDGSGPRPDEAEHRALARVIEAARRTGGRAHVLHLSSAGALDLPATARRDGVAVSAETCPHYLTFEAARSPTGPPSLSAAHPSATPGTASGCGGAWSTASSTWFPRTTRPARPSSSTSTAATSARPGGGIASLQVRLPAVWTAARARGHRLPGLARWMAEGPAEPAGLGRKGRIGVGADADLCVLAPEEVRGRSGPPAPPPPGHPYAGLSLTGVVRSTWLRGQQVTGHTPRGRLLARGAA